MNVKSVSIETTLFSLCCSQLHRRKQHLRSVLVSRVYIQHEVSGAHCRDHLYIVWPVVLQHLTTPLYTAML